MFATFRFGEKVVMLLSVHLIFAAVATTEDQTLINFAGKSFKDPKIEKLANCTPAAIEQFPKLFINSDLRKQGWVAVHIVIAIYMFLCLSCLCEDYFIPSIEVLTERWHVDPDVAGATFMAAASSVPAIAASIIAILVAKGDLGVSTALGSAVLNAAGVVSVSALFAGKVIVLHRWPLYRDNFFFLMSVALMLIVMCDDLITWYESATLTIMYILYAVFMSFDATMEQFFVGKLKFLQDRVDCSEGIFPAQTQQQDMSLPVPKTMSTEKFDSPIGAPIADVKTRRERFSLSSQKAIVESPSAAKVELGSDAERESNVGDTGERTQSIAQRGSRRVSLSVTHGLSLRPPSNHFLRVLWLLYLPFAVLFYLTIPDCQKKELKKYFVLTFLVSTMYITVASYILVWMIAVIGFTLSISDTVMGLSFLAIGVTLPDIVSSLLVARKGEGDMAVCNAMGSNIFEIFVGLGLPWFIKTAIMEPGVPIVVESKGMIYSTISLLATLVFLIALTHWNNWRMNKLYGAILMGWYLVFLALSSAYELGAFGNTKPPTCASNY